MYGRRKLIQTANIWLPGTVVFAELRWYKLINAGPIFGSLDMQKYQQVSVEIWNSG